jgi:TrmH family RNA methyltransferase
MLEVILVELKIPENVGFVARVMKNFGLRNLSLYRCKVDESSYFTAAHAKDVLEGAKIIYDLEEHLQQFDFAVATTGVTAESQERYLRRPAFTPEQLREYVKGKTAILFGREDFGLLSEELELCDAIVTVPTSPEYPVMNVSHAAAIILYELSKGKYEVEPVELASKKDVEILLQSVEKLMRETWFPEHRIRKGIVMLRRGFGRSKFSKHEINMLVGVIRKTLLYMEHIKEKYGKS